ncbi:alpha/beta fold hydrolase [Streptomyces varsoviensis]|nr:alpha/beta hydrolase [Streptomyces varsoviensis]
MALISVNGIRINYEDHGSGEPVVMIMGTGGGGRAWRLHQVPALTAAGYRVITFDNRGIPPTDACPGGFTIDDMVADTAGLIEALGLGPARVVGTSLGGYIAQELALARPELVRQAVLMATRGRVDAMGRALATAEAELYDSGPALPPRYAAVVRAQQNLSPRTLEHDEQARDWLDLFEMVVQDGPGTRVQMDIAPPADRLRAYRRITVPCHVIAFTDDLITPAKLGREVADAIPDATYDEIAACGHYGYLEDPAAVNKAIVEFFRGPARG